VEDIVVHIIVAAAVLFLAQWLVRNLVVKTEKPSCGGCDQCPTEPSAAREGESQSASSAASHHTAS